MCEFAGQDAAILSTVHCLSRQPDRNLFNPEIVFLNFSRHIAGMPSVDRIF